MKNTKIFQFLLIFLLLGKIGMSEENTSIFDFNFKDIDNNYVNLSIFKGNPILVINTASRCGFTPQYAGLQNLFSIYKKTDLTIIAVTSNSFNQEYSDVDEIKKICLINYNVGFLVSSPIEVNGENSHPIFSWIKQEYNQAPKWNFYKYLFDRSGKLVDSWSSITKPDNKKIINSINKLI